MFSLWIHSLTARDACPMWMRCMNRQSLLVRNSLHRQVRFESTVSWRFVAVGSDVGQINKVTLGGDALRQGVKADMMLFAGNTM